MCQFHNSNHMTYPIKAVFLILLIACMALIVEVATVFVRLQYSYYRFGIEKNILPDKGFISPCGNVNGTISPDSKEKLIWIQKRSAEVATYCSLIAGCLGLCSIIPSGVISDKFGRKPVIIIAFLGSLLTAVFTGLIILFQLPIWMFYVAVIPNGLLFHGFSGLFCQVQTCTTDISVRATLVLGHQEELMLPGNVSATEYDEEVITRQLEGRVVHKLNTAHHRLILLGVFDGAIGVMYALTQTFVGEMIAIFGFDLPIYVIFIVGGITTLLLVIMPETKTFLDSQISTTPSGENQSTTYEESQIQSSNQIFSFLTPAIAIGIFINLLTSLVFADSSVTTLYLMGQPFCWDPAQVGVFVGIKCGAGSLATAIISLVIFFRSYCITGAYRPSQDVLMTLNDDTNLDNGDQLALIAQPYTSQSIPGCSKRRRYVKITSYMAGALFLIFTSRVVFGLAFLTTAPIYTWMVYISVTLSVLAYYTPVIKSLLSSCVKPEEQGRLFSLSGCADALGMMLGLTLQPVLYSSTLFFSGLVFLVGAGVLFLAIVLVACMGCFLSRQVSTNV